MTEVDVRAEERKKAPDFSARSVGGHLISLRDLRGKWVVLYFYPRNNTPGCTREACDFRDSYQKLESLQAVVIGCSPDDLTSHGKFAAKYALPFALIEDPGHAVALAYGVWVEKNLYGRKSMGVKRSTFLIDPRGMLYKAWIGVRVDGHIDAIIAEICSAYP